MKSERKSSRHRKSKSEISKKSHIRFKVYPITTRVRPHKRNFLHRRSQTPGTITIHASLTEPHQGATKQKR